MNTEVLSKEDLKNDKDGVLMPQLYVGVSAGFFRRLIFSMEYSSIFEYWDQVYFWDLGLDPHQVDFLNNYTEMNGFKGKFIVRKFNLEKYPDFCKQSRRRQLLIVTIELLKVTFLTPAEPGSKKIVK